MDTAQSARDGSGRLALLGLLLIQIIIGYEWFVSGLTKIVRGGFPSGLAEELTEKSEGVGGWYGSFLDDVVIPNASTFGYLIIIGEVLVGVGLIAAALVWLFAWERLSIEARMTIAVVTLLASLGGILMNLSFHLANGSAHPWLIPAEGFDEGVDLDSVMPAIQLVFVIVSTGLLVSLRRARRTATGILGAHPSGV